MQARARTLQRVAAMLPALIASLVAATASASADPVLGNTAVEHGRDYNGDGIAEAFPFTSSSGGYTDQASVYVGGDSAATGLVVGLYADNGGAPGTLIAQAWLTSPVSHAWNNLPFPIAPVSAGTPYWLAILGTGGQLNFRDDATDGSCQSVTSDPTSVMPTSFTDSWWNTCNVSAYLSLQPTSDPPAPASVSAPTISGDFSYHGTGEGSYGGTITATVGAWASSTVTTTYSFDWQQCDASGANCTDVAPNGPIPNTYVITPSEVGSTLRVVVTAVSSSGTTTAYSNTSPVITAS